MRLATYIATILLFSAVLVPQVALAQGFTTGGGSTYTTGGGSPYTTGGGCGPGTNGTFTLCDPLGVKNFCDLVRSLLNVVLAIGLPVAVFFFVWSGFKFILARGNQEKLNIAKQNFFYVIIGIAVFLGAWTLATIISATIQTLDQSGTIQFCGRS